MEVCPYSEAAIDAVIKPEGYGKRLMVNPSRALAATDNTKDLEMYFEEMERYNQARLAYLVRILTSSRLLRAHSGTEDFCNEKGDTVRPTTPVKLQLETSVQDIVKLTNVTIPPKVGGQCGNAIMGTLEAHVNGFQYKTSSAHPIIDVVYENIKCAFYRVGDHMTLPLLHFHLHNQIMLGTEETNNIIFRLESTIVGKTDGRNKDLQDFVDKVDNLWDSKPIQNNSFESPEFEFHGVLPEKVPSVFALTLFSLVELVETSPNVVSLGEIEIVNLALLRPNEFDMTVVFEDFSSDVFQINSIPLKSLAGIKRCLNFGSVKYYENERELDWNDQVKKFRDSPQKFIKDGGWESLNLESGDACDCYYWEEAGDSDEEEW